jgi:hypothetical protein
VIACKSSEKRGRKREGRDKRERVSADKPTEWKMEKKARFKR